MLGLRFYPGYTRLPCPSLNRLSRVPPGHGNRSQTHTSCSLKTGGRYERAPDTLFQMPDESELSAMQDDGTPIREEDEDDIDEPAETLRLNNMQLSEEV